MTKRILLAGLLAGLAAGCAQPKRVPLPPPLSPGERGAASERAREFEGGDQGPRELQRAPTPAPPADSSPPVAGAGRSVGLPPLRGEPINANIEGIPVPAFINTFFGSLLGVGYQMDPAVARMTDLVTLRTPGPQSPPDFYRLAVEVLRSYGVSTRYENGRVHFVPSSEGGDFDPPLVLSGRALPEVPITHRPIFQLVELKAVRTADVSQWLKTAFQTDALEVHDDLNRNAIVLYGKPDVVRQAAEAIRVLDRPYMRGRVSTRLQPAFVTAEDLARRLVDVMVAEGYGATIHSGNAVIQAAAVVVLPVASANTVLLFASDPALLEHAVAWARTIDQPNPTAGGSSLFYYMVENTRAEDIAGTLNGVRAAVASAAAPAPAAAPAAGAADAAARQAPAAAAQPLAAGGQLLVDEPRNALIFQGTATEWGRLLPLVKQMDRAARQVMIEVTIAEITLDDNEQFGVSWLAKNDIGRFNGTVTSGILGGAGNTNFSGLTYLLDVAGQTRAQLRAFAEDNRVTVLSTPRLMVKSGAEASIDVGTEVPTITAQTTSPIQMGGDTGILQSVQYRKTGILLRIKPIVYSDNRIDLEITQEVSEALPLGADSAVPSPSIFNRAVTSSLSLRDGSSILIGGLMSSRKTDSDSGVPYLKDIPVLGNVFKSRDRQNNRTELVLMIVPYIVESDDDARALTQSVGNRLELLELPPVGQPVPTTALAPAQPVPAPPRPAPAPAQPAPAQPAPAPAQPAPAPAQPAPDPAPGDEDRTPAP